MKQVVVYVGIWVLCLQLGNSLLCYYCPYETPSAQCTDTINCSSDDMVCKTTVVSPDIGYPFHGTEVVIRGCSLATTCLKSADQEGIGIVRHVFCCDDELCNNRGLYVNSSAITAKPATGISFMGILLALITLGL